MFDIDTIRRINSACPQTKREVQDRYPGARVTRAANNSWKIEHFSTRDVPVLVTYLHMKTEVVKILSDGSVILNSGGWQTRTTKGRLNLFQGRVRVFSDRGRWYVRASDDSEAVRFQFVDRMKIYPSGAVGYPGN